jgi:hypothetical protein
MARPLWRLLLPLLLVGAAFQRGAAATMLMLDDGSALAFGLALEAAVLIAAGVAVFVGGRPILWAAIAFGIASAVSAGLVVAVLGAPATPMALGKLAVGVLGAGGLAFLSRADPSPDAPA